jgi:hypothetical protein
MSGEPQMVYDLRGRLVNTQTFRSAPSWWTSGAPAASGAPLGYVSPSAIDAVTQGLLESRSVTCDEADNPVLVADGRTPSEWPAGSKPVTKRMTYDDAYRVTRVEYLNPAGTTLSTGTRTTDAWVDPFAAEDANYSARSPADPTTTGNPRPMPHAALPTRIAGGGLTAGSGGSSFSSGANPINLTGYRTGDGLVLIERIR